jgi:hypothetical protein
MTRPALRSEVTTALQPPTAEEAYADLATQVLAERAAAALNSRRLNRRDAFAVVVARETRPTHELVEVLLAGRWPVASIVEALLHANRPAREIRDTFVVHRRTPFCEIAAALRQQGWTARKISEVFAS